MFSAHYHSTGMVESAAKIDTNCSEPGTKVKVLLTTVVLEAKKTNLFLISSARELVLDVCVVVDEWHGFGFLLLFVRLVCGRTDRQTNRVL